MASVSVTHAAKNSSSDDVYASIRPTWSTTGSDDDDNENNEQYLNHQSPHSTITTATSNHLHPHNNHRPNKKPRPFNSTSSPFSPTAPLSRRHNAINMPPALLGVVAVLCLLLPHPFANNVSVRAAHITGTFQPQHEFFHFVIKFGFQRTERHAQSDSFGYIYGNITSPDRFDVPLQLVVLDHEKFLDFYGNRTIYDKTAACQHMFQGIERYAYDSKCNPYATGDYLRRVPCPHGELCADEDAAANVIPGNQFTFVISNVAEPSFWYVALVACYRNTTTCRWQHYDDDDASSRLKSQPPPPPGTSQMSRLSNATTTMDRSIPHPATIRYDMKLVQGNPSNHPTPIMLTYEFSFDQAYILQMQMVFFCLYVALVPLQLHAVGVQKHPVTKLFTFSLVLEFVSLILSLWHLVRFALTGVGNEVMRTTGDIFDIFSRTTFMLLLLLLAKGWAVTRQQVSRTSWIILMTIWIPYCAFHVVLYVWNRTEVDIISDIDEYQTWPGTLVLACRTAFMFWFLYELRNTMKYEHSNKKLDFLLHFGASSLVWFIYLPVVAVIALQVSPMWRCKLLLGITNSADCLAYCVMTGLLWPNRSGQYLLLAGNNLRAGMDELDELNEAPNIVRGDVNLPRNQQLNGNHADAGGRQPNAVQHLERILHDYGDDDDDEEEIVLSTDDLLHHSHATSHVPKQMSLAVEHAQRLGDANGRNGGGVVGAPKRGPNDNGVHT